MDDFKLMPVAAIADLTLLNELEKYSKIEERIIEIGRDEVLKLLKCSLRSSTPLSETFLKPSIVKSSNELCTKYEPNESINPSVHVKDFWKKRTNIHLKLIFDKVNNIALYAVVKEDFVDLLCFFLSCPLGYIFNQFPCLSFEGCLGNLYTSIQGTDINLFCCKERKELLVNPKLAPGLPYNSNLINIEEANIKSECSKLVPLLTKRKKLMNSKSKQENPSVFEGFLKEPTTFVVMDNLEVKPLSPISVKLLLDKLMVPLDDIGEKEVILDEDKAMRLLAASLASEHALTATFLPKHISVDCKIMAESSAQSFCVKILVAKEENKVIMAELDKELIDVLFSFMLMPVASVVRRTRDCLSGDIGCFSNLYASIENLQMKFFRHKSFRDVVLYPRSAAEIHCKSLGLNLIENDSNDFYVCDGKYCELISCYNTGECRCGKKLEHKITDAPAPSSWFFPEEEGAFLKSTTRFIIMDDFKVMPADAIADLTLLNELEKYSKIEERIIIIGRDEVLKLLKCSLRSTTPLSETFLEPSINKSSNELLCMKDDPNRGMNPSVLVKDLSKKTTNIHLKLVFNKVNNMALYAVVKEDFVNLLCTFLSFPLGYIFNQFPCLSFEGCLGNLYTSIQGTDINLFCCKERKEILVNPKLAPGLPYNTNLISIEEANIKSECSKLASILSAFKKNMNFKSMKENPSVFEGFIKEPATFVVMDNLEVKPLSPVSVKLLLDKLMVPIDDIGEQEVILDADKAMRLLAASLASEHALTATFLPKHSNVDCLDFLRLLWGGNGSASVKFKGY